MPHKRPIDINEYKRERRRKELDTLIANLEEDTRAREDASLRSWRKLILTDESSRDYHSTFEEVEFQMKNVEENKKALEALRKERENL